MTDKLKPTVFTMERKFVSAYPDKKIEESPLESITSKLEDLGDAAIKLQQALQHIAEEPTFIGGNAESRQTLSETKKQCLKS